MKFKTGDKVRVKRSVEHPHFGWGRVTHDDIGVVASYSRYQVDELIVHFPVFQNWSAKEYEIELVSSPEINCTVEPQTLLQTVIQAQKSTKHKPNSDYPFEVDIRELAEEMAGCIYSCSLTEQETEKYITDTLLGVIQKGELKWTGKS